MLAAIEDRHIRERISEWRTQPLLFVKQALKAEPDNWQRNILYDLSTRDRIAIRSGHGPGKSALLSWAILWFLVTHFPAKIPVTGSNFDQLRKTLWSELSLWLGRMPEVLRGQWVYSAESLAYRRAPEESFAVLRTASKERAQGLAGFHARHVMVVVDEASAVANEIFTVLRGALTTEGAKLLIAGNPVLREGDFFDAFHKQRQFYKTHHISSIDSPRVSRAWIQEQADYYGEDSNVYRVRVLGEFPLQDWDGVIPLPLLEAAAAREIAAIDIAPVWGIDVARYGSDRSAIAKRQGNVQLEPVKHRSGLDTEQLAGWIMQEWLETPRQLRPDRINIDVIGIGAGVYDRLARERRFQELGPTTIASVNVAEMPSGRERFERLRDELWWTCREWLEARDCRLCPEDQALIGELAGPKYEPRPNGKLRVESKDDMKKRGLRSPDLADAWVHTFAGSLSASRTTELAWQREPERAIVEYDEHRW